MQVLENVFHKKLTLCKETVPIVFMTNLLSIEHGDGNTQQNWVTASCSEKGCLRRDNEQPTQNGFHSSSKIGHSVFSIDNKNRGRKGYHFK
jgi:hypothetical protein